MVRLFNALHKRPSTRRHRRVDGFKVGVTLVLLAFGLMGIRTYFSYIDAKVQGSIGTVASKKQALRDLQKDEGNLGISHNTSRPLAVETPVYDFNPHLGRTTAPIQIILFGNPTCAECRTTLEALNRLTRRHISQMSLVVKTIPKPSGYDFQDVALNHAIEAGLFATLAAEKGEYWPFIEKLGTEDTLNADVYVNVLAGLGIPLREIRSILGQNNERFLRQMEQDMALLEGIAADELPVIIMNGTLLEPLYGQTLSDQAVAAASAFLR